MDSPYTEGFPMFGWQIAAGHADEKFVPLSDAERLREERDEAAGILAQIQNWSETWRDAEIYVIRELDDILLPERGELPEDYDPLMVEGMDYPERGE